MMTYANYTFFRHFDSMSSRRIAHLVRDRAQSLYKFFAPQRLNETKKHVIKYSVACAAGNRKDIRFELNFEAHTS